MNIWRLSWPEKRAQADLAQWLNLQTRGDRDLRFLVRAWMVIPVSKTDSKSEQKFHSPYMNINCNKKDNIWELIKFSGSLGKIFWGTWVVAAEIKDS